MDNEEFFRNFIDSDLPDEYFLDTDTEKILPPFEQLGILLIDRSGSMGRAANPPGVTVSKMDEVISHLFASADSFINALDESSVSRAFHLAYIAFDSSAEAYQEPAPLPRPDEAMLKRLTPENHLTNIHAALEKARDMAFEWLQTRIVANAKKGEGEFKQEPFVVILLLSDGGHSFGPHPIDIADEIKERLSETVTLRGASLRRGSIAVARYGTGPVDEFPAEEREALARLGINDNVDLLRALASDPKEEFFAMPTNGAQLRTFFIKSFVGALG